jgi:predicted nucleotidyltransferase
MAKGNFREYLRGDVVKLKKYFYVLRPLLAARWVETREDPVPMEFDRLVDGLVTDPALRGEIDALVARKRAGTELDRGPRIEPISAFVEAEMERIDAVAPPDPTPPIPRDVLDELFRATLASPAPP